MILAFSVVLNNVVMWYYNDKMEVMFWGIGEYYEFDDASIHTTLQDVRSRENPYEILYDSGDE